MRQVTSHIPLVYHFFFDLAGFSGFFSRSPQRTSVSDSTQTPKSKHSNMGLPYPCHEHCVWAQRWQPSGEFEPTTLDAGGLLRLLDDDTFSFFLKLFHCIMTCVDILFSQLQKRIINSVFVQGIMQQLTQFFWLQCTLLNSVQRCLQL